MKQSQRNADRGGDPNGTTPPPQPGHVFFSYVRENADLVDQLADAVRRSGVKVWIDRTSIRPGMRWRNAIREAIEQGALFVACFSQEYMSKEKSFMNEELMLAIDELRQYSDDKQWFIPIKLNACSIPAKEIGGGQTLRDLQWLDLAADWEGGVRALLLTLSQYRQRAPISGNNLLLSIEKPFRERIREATQLWVAGGRATDGLVNGKAFFAAQCWTYSNRVSDPQSASYDPDITELVMASRAGIGGDAGWDEMLNDHIACELCRENFRFENIRISLSTMMYVCPFCDVTSSDPDDLVG